MTGNRLQQASPLKSRGAQAGAGTVRVICGVHTLEAHVAGRSVEDVRTALGQALNISPAAVAVVDGVEVGAGHVLREGEQLEFVRLAGEKGRSGAGRRPASAPPIPAPSGVGAVGARLGAAGRDGLRDPIIFSGPSTASGGPGTAEEDSRRAHAQGGTRWARACGPGSAPGPRGQKGHGAG